MADRSLWIRYQMPCRILQFAEQAIYCNTRDHLIDIGAAVQYDHLRVAVFPQEAP